MYVLTNSEYHFMQKEKITLAGAPVEREREKKERM